MMSRLLGGLDRFNTAHPWSHNDAYTPWVLRHARKVRRGGGSVALDVGCGTGNLMRKLAPVMREVVGVERDPETAARARRNLSGFANAIVREEPFERMSHARPEYDLVTFVAVLHHLPQEETLQTVRSLVRPGGRLLVVGLARETRRDHPWAVASMLLNPVIGAIRHPRPTRARPEGMSAPTAEPRETFDEVAAVARRVLPGVRCRRSLFWRYTAVWVAPGA
ncbi:MAG: class I SAM-dependent methyltransferase [Microbacteriaceae bacterium]|nr:class I SAM-dependent methyltransferase [Microbacteriaceae bacterium]